MKTYKIVYSIANKPGKYVAFYEDVCADFARIRARDELGGWDKVTVGYEDPYNHFTEEERTFYLNWTAEDAEEMVQRYNLLHFRLPVSEGFTIS